MYCTKCGQQIPDGNRFCENCGTPAKQLNVASAPQEKEPSFPGSFSTFKKKISTIDNLSVCYLLSGALFVLLTVFWFVDCIEVSVLIADASISLHGIFVMMKLGILSLVFVALFLSSAAVCVYPVWKKSLNRYRAMVFTKISAFLCLGWFLFVIIDGVFLGTDVTYAGYVGVSVTFGGCLLLIVNIALIIVLFQISKKSKKWITTVQ